MLCLYCAGLGICSFAHLLISSDSLDQMSDCERFAQIALDKWATVSEPLRLLMTNEQITRFFERIAHLLFSSQKTSNSPQKIWLNSYFFCKFYKKDLFAHYLFFNERCEPIAQVAHQKWAIWANHSGHPPKISDHERFTQVTHQNEQIAHYLLIFLQKTSNLLRKPMSKFPTLVLCLHNFSILELYSSLTPPHLRKRCYHTLPRIIYYSLKMFELL